MQAAPSFSPTLILFLKRNISVYFYEDPFNISIKLRSRSRAHLPNQLLDRIDT